MKKKIDPETEKIFTTNEKLRAMTESSGWGIAKSMLIKKAAALLNMSDISDLNPQTIVQVIGIRQETAKALLAWVREIEGVVDQHKANAGSYVDVKDEYIVNIEDQA